MIVPETLTSRMTGSAGTRRAPGSQSGMLVPPRDVQVRERETVREPRVRPKEKKGMDRPSKEAVSYDAVGEERRGAETHGSGWSRERRKTR